MFFYISKVIGLLAMPSNACVLVGVVGLILVFTRWKRAAMRLMATSIVLLLVLGISPLADAMLLPLSERFPPWREGSPPPAGIIVLGGGVSPEETAARGIPELNAAGERMTAVAGLARRYPQARIVFTGGNNNLVDNSMTEANVAAALFDTFGISRERVLLEDRSRTTAENAAFTRNLLKPQPGERFLLVTSAYHMPRSIGVFRRAGFAVDAYPVDFRTRGWIDAATPFSTIAGGLARSDTAVHEWLGLIAYRLSGRSAELLPSP